MPAKAMDKLRVSTWNDEHRFRASKVRARDGAAASHPEPAPSLAPTQIVGVGRPRGRAHPEQRRRSGCCSSCPAFCTPLLLLPTFLGVLLVALVRPAQEDLLGVDKGIWVAFLLGMVTMLLQLLLLLER